MKKLVEETNPEGLVKFLGERVTLFCMNYFYTGVLTGINDADVLLTDAFIVYETGAFTTQTWQDAQKLPGDIYVRIAAIEAYGKVK